MGRCSLTFAIPQTDSRQIRKCLSGLLAALLLSAPLSVTAAPQGKTEAADGSPPRIALTFDDGPSEQYTAEILDILQANRVKATFFVLGTNAERHPDLLLRTIAEGHEVGNHTYTHPHLQKIDEESLADEVLRTDTLLRKIADYSPTLFRPPEGYISPAVKAVARHGGYSLVLWTIDTRDWALNSEANILHTIQSKASDGDIILFHDYVVGKSPTPEVLRKIIPWLKEKGFEFVTVSELLK